MVIVICSTSPKVSRIQWFQIEWLVDPLVSMVTTGALTSYETCIELVTIPYVYTSSFILKSEQKVGNRYDGCRDNSCYKQATACICNCRHWWDELVLTWDQDVLVVESNNLQVMVRDPLDCVTWWRWSGVAGVPNGSGTGDAGLINKDGVSVCVWMRNKGDKCHK